MPAQALQSATTVPNRAVLRANRAAEILGLQADSLNRLKRELDSASFDRAVDLLVSCEGNVVVTGIGKAGIVGKKISASLSSTGTPSHFLHPGEAMHGDLGTLRAQDVVLLLSYSGETEEVVGLLDSVNPRVKATIAITGQPTSRLAQGVDVTLLLGSHNEACALGLAPSTSTTLMMAMGDALTLVASEALGFTSEQFKQFHPGGSLGRKLTNVTEVMRPMSHCRIAQDSLSVGQVFVHSSRPGRRTGAILLLDDAGRLSGIFTDSDLARLLEQQGANCLESPIASVMTRDYRTTRDEATLDSAIALMTMHKISELPVLSSGGIPLGIIDITDILGSSESPPNDEPTILPFDESPNHLT